jgi:uncharacterized protein YyaL (SSP411 family)
VLDVVLAEQIRAGDDLVVTPGGGIAHPAIGKRVTMSNRLATASSPYLLQHADNPVDWWPWSPEAFDEARRRDVPVFLSVGYSSCHWCHVMAHESFEDDDVAKVLNDTFVSIKVDREERPDVDSVYMGAVQAMTGQGGWPMSVFCSPEGTPFHAGTYWPKQSRGGMPGFLQVLAAVTRAWDTDRDSVNDLGGRLTEHLRRGAAVGTVGTGADAVEPDAGLALAARSGCLQGWDRELGGFGGAPKFPQAMTIDFLLAHHVRTGDDEALAAATHALDAMSAGGIHDQIGGGFARYATDAHWLVPHFEKMLYDNALLLRAYTHAAWVTGAARHRFVALRIADWLTTVAQTDEGGFVSAFDADSEGVEGKFFVWAAEEFAEVVSTVGEEPDEWAARYGVTPAGNFALEDGSGRATILHEAQPFDFDDADLVERRRRVDHALAERRATRVPPGTDDKVLTSWNALAIEALAEAGVALARPDLVEAARRGAEFLADHLLVDGLLHHTWTPRRGPQVPAFAEDVAGLARALLVLFDADQDPRWFRWSQDLAVDADDRFRDTDGTYFDTATDAEELLARPKATWDNANPAPSSVMAEAHLRLAGLTGDPVHAERADAVLRAFAASATAAPTGHGELLRALERSLDAREVAIVGAPADRASLVDTYRRAWRPSTVLALGDGTTPVVPLLTDRTTVDGRPAAYVCRNFACARPVTTAAGLAALL